MNNVLEHTFGNNKTLAVLRDIRRERERHMEQEGFSRARDDGYTDGSLAMAAASYAFWSVIPHPGSMMHLIEGRWMPKIWPWKADWWKPGAARRMLVKAGALIVAEIERLDRAAARENAGILAEQRRPRPTGREVRSRK